MWFNHWWWSWHGDFMYHASNCRESLMKPVSCLDHKNRMDARPDKHAALHMATRAWKYMFCTVLSTGLSLVFPFTLLILIPFALYTFFYLLHAWIDATPTYNFSRCRPFNDNPQPWHRMSRIRTIQAFRCRMMACFVQNKLLSSQN